MLSGVEGHSDNGVRGRHDSYWGSGSSDHDQKHRRCLTEYLVPFALFVMTIDGGLPAAMYE